MKTSGEKLKELRERTPLSIRAMAEAIDLNYGTYNSRESRSKKPYLEYNLAEKLIPIFKEYGIDESEILALVNPNFTPNSDNLNHTYTVLEIAEAGKWGKDKRNTENPETITLPTGASSLAPEMFAVKVLGSSMNRTELKDNSYAICLPPNRLTRKLKSGDKLLIKNKKNEMIETQILELDILEDGSYWLWPRSSHPEHQAPAPIKSLSLVYETSADMKENCLYIAGVVAGSFQTHLDL